ncbi:hypothetical protein [Catellatospora sp. NPDC049609]|uniref:hypothetical protein n=1 Tax=Catellatospora sp. NPDC049609 TaxID=3155505 RepID=UPI00342EB33D
MTALAPAVDEAVAAIRDQYACHQVHVLPDGSGGATIIVDDISIGTAYRPQATWLGFHVNAAYPASDVYPHYCGLLERSDGQAHGPGITATTWQGRPALQLSRRSNGWNSVLDNAVLKAEKVIRWLKSL